MWIIVKAFGRGGDAYLTEHFDGRSPGGFAAKRLMQLDRLDYLSANGIHRVQGDKRLLEDHCDPVTANPAHVAIAELEQVLM
jgi:hypothetical protein